MNWISYRKFTESTISIQNVTSSRAEFEGKRFVFGWSDIPELSSRAYMVSLFSEYASVGGAFHDRLSEKYSGQAVGGDAEVDVLSMLTNHPFITEPNDSVVLADQNKQKIGQEHKHSGQRHAGRCDSLLTASASLLLFFRRHDSDGDWRARDVLWSVSRHCLP